MESFLHHYGYLALIVLTIAEAACIPIPSEVTVGYAGVLAASGKLNLAAVIVVATLGEVIGAFVGYALGRYGGRPLVERFGRYVLLSHADLDRAERWFDSRGEWSVLVGRVVPLVRTFIALPAGIAEMELPRFAVFTSLGSLVWIGALAGVGYGIGDKINRLTKGFSIAGYVMAALIVLAVGIFVALRWRHVRAERAGGDVHGTGPTEAA